MLSNVLQMNEAYRRDLRHAAGENVESWPEKLKILVKISLQVGSAAPEPIKKTNIQLLYFVLFRFP